MEIAGKGFLRLLYGKGRVHFSAKKCCVKCAKKAMPEEKAEKGKLRKLMPIIYIKGNCYETPLYGHVLGDKWNCDKRRGMRSGRSPKGGGGEGERG